MSRFIAVFEAATIRDHNKPKIYFEQFITEQRNRIANKINKLEQASGDKKQRILVSLIQLYIDLFKAEFSNGATAKELKEVLTEALKYVSEYKNATYDDLLFFASVSVVLNVVSSVKSLIGNNKAIANKDRLISYLVSNGSKWDDSLELRSEYELLDPVFTSNDPIAAMDTYMKNWYDKHNQSAWYNNHLSDVNTYTGYWSFEAAAIVKLLHLNDAKLAKYNSYPKL